MNKILVEVSVGEFLDKISILEIKKEKITFYKRAICIYKDYRTKTLARIIES